MFLKNPSGILQQKMLMVLASITLIVLGVLSFWYVSTSINRQSHNHREALRMAESGLQDMLQKINENSKIEKLSIEKADNEDSYAVNTFPLDSLTMRIEAKGQVGSAKRSILCVVKKNPQGVGFSVQSWEEQ